MAKMKTGDQRLLKTKITAIQTVWMLIISRPQLGEKNNGFDVLYHNMKHGQISTKELADLMRERATIEEAYSRSMTKLAKSASNYSELGTFAPVWDVFKTSTEKLASCHLELVRKLQELIKEVHKYGEEQSKAHKKTKEEVAGTLESVQNIQTITQGLQKSKEIYNTKCVEQERLKKEGATQKEIEKAGVKTKKATETYKLFVDKYGAAKTDFEQKMTETAQKFQDIEEFHLIRMKEIIKCFSEAMEETHLQISQVHEEFVNNMENTTAEFLIQKFAETKGTGKDRPGPIEFEECNPANAVEGVKPRKRKAFAITARIKNKEKDTDSAEMPDADSLKTSNGAPSGYYGRIDLQNANIPEVDEEGYSIKPEGNQNDAKENHFYSSSDSESEDEERRKFHVEIKPVQPNNGTPHTLASLDELKASIGNITLSPSISRHSPAAMKRNSSSEELGRTRLAASSNDKKSNSDLLSLDPLFRPPLDSSSSTSTSSSALSILAQESLFTSSILSKDFTASHTVNTAELTQQKENSSCSPSVVSEPPLEHQPDSGPRNSSPDLSNNSVCNPTVTKMTAAENMDVLSPVLWSRSQWISFSDELVPLKRVNPNQKETQRLQSKFQTNCSSPVGFLQTSSSTNCPSDDLSDLCSDTVCHERLFVEENDSASGSFSSSSSTPVDISLMPVLTRINNVSPPARPTTPHTTSTLVPPPRPASRPKFTTGKRGDINEVGRSFSPPVTSNTSPSPSAPLARAESTSSISSSASLSAANTPTVGISRGPSPVSLGSQDTLPVAAAFTESVNAYFKGADPAKCIVKITGDMTLSFPSGIIRVFTSNPSPAVLCFKLKNTSRLEQILPNAQLLYSDPSQSDSNTKDFWMNMQALTAYLKKMSEQNPSASYYNVDILKYQVSSNGIQSTPLNLVTYWKCTSTTTDVRVDYKYNPESMITASMLSNLQLLVPVDGGVLNMQSLPPAVWNAEQMKALWKLHDISERSENKGSGTLRAKFDLTEGPSKPSTLAVQFISEGSTLSGVDMELVGTGYRLSLIKKRFATGRYMADC
nr:PREDICTED: F-BAR domain only protein 2 isoform X3 [Latimeria chalumnae]|eukprot:XP_014345575.1 PREDICTED: F-BAR domain only protein 2 isoform X3 [Latimeria chalumnae]